MIKTAINVRYMYSARFAVFVWIICASLLSTGVLAQTTEDVAKEEKTEVTRKLVEIYRIAPGKHEEFLRFVAYLDEINIKAGLPARDLYVHSDGASWDFILIQPASTPEELSDAYDKAWDESGAPSGVNFFLHIRKFIVEHSDTFAYGPTSAGEYLSGVTPSPGEEQ